MSLQEHPVSRVERMIAAVQQGEHSELGVLLNLYRGYLLTVAGHELGSDVVAKAAPSDLVQETFLEASQAFADFRGSTEP
jgi:RNA polymerase sigma-70 factor (ECF subfamily)